MDRVQSQASAPGPAVEAGGAGPPAQAGGIAARRALLTAAALAVAAFPWLGWELIASWGRPHGPWSPLLLPGAAVLAWRRCRGLGALTPGAPGVALAAAVACGAAWAAALALVSPWLATASALGMALAAGFGAGGGRLVRALVPVCLLVAAAVPPPLDLDGRAHRVLQTVTSHWAGALLDVLGVVHVVEGNVLHLADRRLLADQAGAGVPWLLPVLGLTLFYAAWVRRPALRSLALLAAAAGWVLAANAVRMAGVALAWDGGGVDLGSGPVHTGLMGATLALAVVLVLSTDNLLGALGGLFHRRASPRGRPGFPDGDFAAPPRPAPAPVRGPTRLAGLGGSWVASLPALAASVVLAGVSVYTEVSALGLPAPYPAGLPPAVARAAGTTLPDRLNGLARRGFTEARRGPGHPLGRVSKVWSYASDHAGAVVALAGPFRDWREATHDFTARGYRPSGRRVCTTGGDSPAVEVDLVRTPGTHAYLLFAQFDPDGHPRQPPGPARSLVGRVVQRLTGRDGPGAGAGRASPGYQVRLLVERPRPLTAAERQEYRALLGRVAGALRAGDAGTNGNGKANVNANGGGEVRHAAG